MPLLAAIIHLPSVPAAIQLLGGAALVLFGLVIWKGKRHVD